ncbi:MAG: hypothetical protein KGL75_05405 [Acidobacteriota bacterium]|nr:hypothetical protein [Acidobacteriota bacterium]
MPSPFRRGIQILVALLAFAAASALAVSQSASPAASSQATPLPKQLAPESREEFLSAADTVLTQMSQILDLPIRRPLKKSLRSRQEIRAYLVKQDKDDKDKARRYADNKALKAFGLIPKNFPLDSFMIDLLTDQVAGMYDPKAKEFYIADWIPISDQREVMAHELTHALEDQSFHIETWIKAARPNDDAEMARDSVSEGSALAAMVDYVLRDEHVGVRDLPDVTQLIRSGALAEMSQDPVMAKAPPYIQDALMFPYLEGTAFSQQFLKAHTGWSDLKLLFENPPVSTQQILHPDLYFKGVRPTPVTLPAWKGIAPKDWKLLEENVLGEFGVQELLKQFLDANRAASLAPDWIGDRYAVFEDSRTGATPLVFRLALDSGDHAAQFFGAYSAALAKKYASKAGPSAGPEFLQFHTSGGDVFFRCIAAECLDVEGVTRETFDSIDRAIDWTPAPVAAVQKSERGAALAVAASAIPSVPAR